jgi:hypothetical protein
MTYGATIGLNDILYMGSSGKLLKAQANAAATMPGLYLALETGNDTESHNVLKLGWFRNDSWSALTVGGFIYLDPATAGAFTQTAPSTTGQFVQILGTAIASKIIEFFPSPVTVGL